MYLESPEIFICCQPQEIRAIRRCNTVSITSQTLEYVIENGIENVIEN